MYVQWWANLYGFIEYRPNGNRFKESNQKVNLESQNLIWRPNSIKILKQILELASMIGNTLNSIKNNNNVCKKDSKVQDQKVIQ